MPMKDILLTFLVAMVPVVELRGAIPFGVVRGLNLWTAIIASVLGNLVPVPFIILFIRRIFAWMRAHMPKLDGLVTRMEKKAEKNPRRRGKVRVLGSRHSRGHPAARHGRVDGRARRGDDGNAAQARVPGHRHRRCDRRRDRLDHHLRCAGHFLILRGT